MTELYITDDDYVIQDTPHGYFVTGLGESFNDYDKALVAIAEDMKNSEFYPDVYYQNDHGNIDLLSFIVESPTESTIAESWV